MIILVALIYFGALDGFLDNAVVFIYEKLFVVAQAANSLANLIF